MAPASRAAAFLERFGYCSRINWYPGHMVKAQRLMRERFSNVNLVIEVRDARVRDSAIIARPRPTWSAGARLLLELPV